MNFDSIPPATLSQKTSTFREVNVDWCGSIADILVANGVQHAVICPGGRSAAMAHALNGHARIATFTHTDERSAAFMAMGIAKASGHPAVVCTTSGSAVANLLPAAIEAEKSHLPLVLLTCNRMETDFNNEAPQVADHMGILATGVRGAINLPAPGITSKSFDWLQDFLSPLGGMLGDFPTKGPVHLNIQLPGYFTSMDDMPFEDTVAEVAAPAFHRHSDGDEAGTVPSVKSLSKSLGLRPGMKGLIVAGCGSTLSHGQMGNLAKRTGFPVLADATSGYRRPLVSGNVICNADLAPFHPETRLLNADLIIRTGLAPCSHSIQDFIRRQTCQTLKIGHDKAFKDFMGQQCQPVPADGKALDELADILSPGDPGWGGKWSEISESIGQRKSEFLASLAWGELRAADCVCNAEGFAFLHLANSMSVRHGNLYCRASDQTQPIYGNRGVNGIDGTLGTFFGELIAHGAPGLLLLGDLAFVHDLPALEAAKLKTLSGCICVVNNGGGGLFSITTSDLVEMRNPVPIDLAGIASAFSLHYRPCAALEELEAALFLAKNTAGISLLDIQVAPTSVSRETNEMFKALTYS